MSQTATQPTTPSASPVEHSVQTINFTRTDSVAAPIEITFAAILEELGPGSTMPDGSSFAMKVEPYPGGRWMRDLGNNTGHLWGHVQVIKPPKLLEICGPMFMSYPATNWIQYRLTPEGNGTSLQFTHRALGLIPADHRTGVAEGWAHGLKRVRELAESRAAKR
jgi:hypothetical protein